MTHIPGRIPIIKEVREVTGLGLADAKAMVDYMFRRGGSMHGMINTILDESVAAGGNPGYVYNNVPTVPTVGVVATPKPYTVDRPSQAELDGYDLEERVARIERWIQNQ